MLGAAHALSGVGVYCLVRRTHHARGAGLVAGLTYAACFWHLQQVLVMGRLPLSLFYALLPWPFHGIEGLRLRPRRARAVATGATSLGALALTHPGYGFWATAAACAYGALRLWQWRGRPDLRPRAAGAALLLAAGLLLGSYLTVGMWLERGATGLHVGLSLTDVPDPDWRALLVWSDYLFPLFPGALPTAEWHAGYLGLSAVALAAIGASSWPRLRGRAAADPVLAAALPTAAFLTLAFGYRWPLLQAVPLVTGLNASRYLLFVVFFGSLLAGAGAAALTRGTRLGRRSAAVAAIALMADLGSASFLHASTPARREHDMLSGDALDALAASAGDMPDGRIPDWRLFTSTGTVHDRVAMAAAHLRGLPTFQSYHPGASERRRPSSAPSRLAEPRAGGPGAALAAGLTARGGARHGGAGDVNVRHVLIEREGEYFLNRKELPHTPSWRRRRWSRCRRARRQRAARRGRCG